jgi:hypothetical protein
MAAGIDLAAEGNDKRPKRWLAFNGPALWTASQI